MLNFIWIGVLSCSGVYAVYVLFQSTELLIDRSRW